MKNLKLIFGFTLMFMFVMTSCNKDDVTSLDSVSSSEKITLIYGDQSYEMGTDEEGNWNTLELPENIQTVLENGNTVQLDELGDIHLFESDEEVTSFLINELEIAGQVVADEEIDHRTNSSAEFFEHYTYRGHSIHKSNSLSISDLRNLHFNDIISSVIVENNSSEFYVVRLYEHTGFRGHAHTIVAHPHTEVRARKLGSNGFNDKASSLKGYFVH